MRQLLNTQTHRPPSICNEQTDNTTPGDNNILLNDQVLVQFMIWASDLKDKANDHTKIRKKVLLYKKHSTSKNVYSNSIMVRTEGSMVDAFHEFLHFIINNKH